MEEQELFSFICVARGEEFRVSVTANALVRNLYEYLQEKARKIVGPFKIAFLREHPNGTILDDDQSFPTQIKAGSKVTLQEVELQQVEVSRKRHRSEEKGKEKEQQVEDEGPAPKRVTRDKFEGLYVILYGQPLLIDFA